MKDFLTVNDFTKEELLLCTKALAEEISIVRENVKREEELYNLPLEKAKRLVKTLTNEEKESLKKHLY